MANSEQDAAHSESVPEKNQAINNKKRSPIELAIICGLICFILIAVLLEFNARYGYSKTLTELQNRINLDENGEGNEFLLADAKELVKGFPSTQERSTNNGKQLQYRWFSMLRTLSIQLSVGIDGTILSLKTDVEPFTDEEIQAPPSKLPIHQPNLPKKGLSKEYENVVVLTTDKLASQAYEHKGMLSREIVRQALLISAREGLGLKTRDTSLRGEVRFVENPESFPLKLLTQIDSGRQVDITLERPHKNKARFNWYSEEFVLPRAFGFEALVEKTEALSRTGFVDALKSAGYTGKAPKQIEETTVPDILLQRLKEWSFISQYTLIQEMHEAIGKEGESPQRLAVLARAYANLGSLTECLWSPAHKVFKARALLYAERLTVRTNDSPWALAHRAYVRALAGRHLSALSDIKAIRSAKKENSKNKRPAPAWINLIDAYCSYKPDILDKAVENEDTKHLAIYLQCLLVDPVANEKQMLTVTEQLLELEPACCGAIDRLCETNSLGILRSVTEEGLDQLWIPMYRKLQESKIPNSAKTPIQRYLSSPFNLISENQLRLNVINALKNSESIDMEPSVNGLGQLLQEVSFIQTYRKLDVHVKNLGFKADEFLPQFRPLLKEHPYEQYLESYSSNQLEAKTACEKLMKSHNPHELELTSFSMILSSSYKLRPQDFQTLFSAAKSNLDHVYQDQIQHARCSKKLIFENLNLQMKSHARMLLHVSPHMPQTVALNIETDKEYVKKHGTELMKKYGKNALVLSALAKRHLADKEDAKAEETLQRRIEIVPDHRTYTTLANLYKKQGETEKWKITLEKALELPSLGLQDGVIQSKLAYYHMDKEEWELAKPYAMKAAETYSAWGLQCAAKCYEGLGDLKRAEVFRRACSMRYDTSAADWYFWCVRTDHGDLKSARQLAEQYLLANPDSGNLQKRIEIGVFQSIQGLKSEAFNTFLAAFRKYESTYCGLHAALLADELEFVDQRDDLLRHVSEKWSTAFGNSELANIFQYMLRKKDSIDWKPVWFQSLLAQSTKGNPTNYYYFAGKLLEQRGQHDLGEKYLQLAATSPISNKFTCLLATHHLRSQNEEINARRTTELETDLDRIILLSKKAFQLKRKGESEAAINKFNEILELKPDLVIVLNNRAQMHEALKNYTAAIADYKKAIKIEPEYWLAHNNLAFLLGGCEKEEVRDGSLSLKHAQKAFDLLPIKYWVNYSAMAVAYAEIGEFEKAVEMQRTALRIAPKSEKDELARRMTLFSEGKPYRRSANKEQDAVK